MRTFVPQMDFCHCMKGSQIGLGMHCILSAVFSLAFAEFRHKKEKSALLCLSGQEEKWKRRSIFEEDGTY